MKQDPSGKKKAKSKNVFKTGIRKDNGVKYSDTDDLDRKISDLIEENKLKTSMRDQVIKLKTKLFCKSGVVRKLNFVHEGYYLYLIFALTFQTFRPHPPI